MNITEHLKKQVAQVTTRKTKTISLELTTYCPLKCKYCKRSEIAGDYNNKKLNWEKFLKLKERLGEFDRLMICGLGETMTYGNIYDALPLLKQRIILVTSGTMAIDYKKLNRKRNLETVVFSLDAPTEKEMVEITGNYNWNNLMKNFQRNRYNRSVFFSVNCTIFENNYHRIPDMVRFAIDNKLTSINFNNALQGTDNLDLKAKIYEKMMEAETIANENGLILSHAFKQLSCIAFGIPIPFITLNGDVYTCCYGMDKRERVGNIYESTFDEMWNSQAYQRLKSGQLCFDNGGCPLLKDLVLGKKYRNSETVVN